MSQRAKRYLLKLRRDRKLGKPSSLSLDEAAELMEAYWQHNREKHLLPLLKKENKRLDALRGVIEELKSIKRTKA